MLKNPVKIKNFDLIRRETENSNARISTKSKK